MKTLRPLILLSIILSFSYIRPTMSFEEGLVAYYSFNQCDARDDSGSGSHGELYGGIDCWCGVDDDGLLLDGIQDYIEFPGVVNRYFGTSDFTVSFYFKAEGHSVFRQSLLSKGENCEDFHVLDFLLDYTNEEIDTRFHETPRKYFPGLSPGLASKGWHHFALVKEGLKATTYIDGEPRQESYRCSGIDIGNDAVLSFSNSPCIRRGSARRFKGVIDELRVYERALSRGEILQLYRLYPIENAQMDCFS